MARSIWRRCSARFFYGDEDAFAVEFEKLVVSIENNLDLLKEASAPLIHAAGAAALQFAMFSIKHRGFEEEQEWRLLHRPHQYASAFVTSRTETIGGIPQTIYELPFHNPERGPEFDIPALHLNNLLEGVVIGPCLYPDTVARAFEEEMTKVGIQDAASKIIVSEIPLRQWG